MSGRKIATSSSVLSLHSVVPPHPPPVPLPSQIGSQTKPLMQQPLYFFARGIRMLMADPFACDRTRSLVQIEGDLEPLLARHLTILCNLRVERRSRVHMRSLPRSKSERTIFCIHADRLPFVNFAFQNLHAQRIENFFLNRAFERSGTVNRIVSLARNQRFRRIA
jgi:hypothetical protein